MQIVIDKDSMIKIIAITLYVASGGDYDKATKTTNELLEEMGYTELPKGHGRLIDADSLMIELMDKDLDHCQSNSGGDEVCQVVECSPTVQAVPIDVLDKIRAEIEQVSFTHYFEYGEYLGEDTRQERIVNFDSVMQIIDKYKAESEGRG